MQLYLVLGYGRRLFAAFASRTQHTHAHTHNSHTHIHTYIHKRIPTQLTHSHTYTTRTHTLRCMHRHAVTDTDTCTDAHRDTQADQHRKIHTQRDKQTRATYDSIFCPVASEMVAI